MKGGEWLRKVQAKETTAQVVLFSESVVLSCGEAALSVEAMRAGVRRGTNAVLHIGSEFKQKPVPVIPRYHFFKKLIEILHNSRKSIIFASEMKKILG